MYKKKTGENRTLTLKAKIYKSVINISFILSVVILEGIDLLIILWLTPY